MHSIYHFLNSRLTDKNELIRQLNTAILPALPPNCKSHIQAANFKDGELTLIADSPVWAARLKTQHKKIITQLQNDLGLPVKTLSIKFQQPVISRPTIAKTKPHLSKHSSELIKNIASSVEDEELKQSLLRLSDKSD